MNLLTTCFNNLNKAVYGVAVFFMYCFNMINNFISRNTPPARLGKQPSFKEQYEVELIFLAGICVIVGLFLFAFFVVGQMDPYTNGGLA